MALRVLDDLLDEFDKDARREAAQVLLAPDAPWTLIILSRHRWVFEGIDEIIQLKDGGPSGHSDIAELGVEVVQL